MRLNATTISPPKHNFLHNEAKSPYCLVTLCRITKYLYTFIKVQAMCKAICAERPSSCMELFITAKGRKEHLGRGLSGIGRKSKYGNQK